MRVAIFRRSHFCAAHRMHNPALSDAENRQIFGLCNKPNYHGHNYELEIKVTGEVNPITGYVLDLKILSQLIESEIVERFDHKNLNLDCPEFAELLPSTENFVIVIWRLLRTRLDAHLELKVRLYETPRNYVEFPA